MSVNNNIMNHLAYGLIDTDTLWSTIRCMKAFKEHSEAKKLQFLNEHLNQYKHLLIQECKNDSEVNEQLEEYYKQTIKSIPKMVYYGEFSPKGLPSTPNLNELKNTLDGKARLFVANKVEGSIWNPITGKRQRHDACVVRLQDKNSKAVLDFKYPEANDDYILFYKFELPSNKQGKGIGGELFTRYWKALMECFDVRGMESPVLDSPDRQPVFDDHRDNWRFEQAAPGQTKLHSWWTKLGGVAKDRAEPNRLYFMRFKQACAWVTDHPDQAQQAQASFGAPIYSTQQQEVLNDVLSAVNMAA